MKWNSWRFGQDFASLWSNERASPGARLRVALSGLAMPKLSVMRVKMSWVIYRQYLSLHPGWCWGVGIAWSVCQAVGYQPNLQQEMVLCRSELSTKKGSITSVQAVYASWDFWPTQLLRRPCSPWRYTVMNRAFDGNWYLSSFGLELKLAWSRNCRWRALSAWGSAAAIQRASDIAILGMEELSDDQKQIAARARRIQRRFLAQPFHRLRSLPEIQVFYVKLKDTIRDASDILLKMWW